MYVLWDNYSVQHDTMIYFNILLPVSSLLVITTLAPSLELSTAHSHEGQEWRTCSILSVWHKWGWWLLFPRPWHQLLNSSKQRKKFLSASIILTSMTRWIHYTPLDSVASSVGSPATAAANVHWSLHRAALVVWLKSISHLLQLPDSCVIASHSTWNNIFFFSAAATSPGHCTGSHWRRCRRCRWWCRCPAQAPAASPHCPGCC